MTSGTTSWACLSPAAVDDVAEISSWCRMTALAPLVLYDVLSNQRSNDEVQVLSDDDAVVDEDPEGRDAEVRGFLQELGQVAMELEQLRRVVVGQGTSRHR